MIVVRTSTVELGLFGDDYDAFVAALREDGLPARIDEPEERRGAEQTALEVGIWIGEYVLAPAAGAAIVDAIRRAAAATISKRKPARRTQPVRSLPVYGPSGEVLARVELPADDDDPAATSSG